VSSDHFSLPFVEIDWHSRGCYSSGIRKTAKRLFDRMLELLKDNASDGVVAPSESKDVVPGRHYLSYPVSFH
jgi:hypothetical protein